VLDSFARRAGGAVERVQSPQQKVRFGPFSQNPCSNFSGWELTLRHHLLQIAAVCRDNKHPAWHICEQNLFFVRRPARFVGMHGDFENRRFAWEK